MPEEAVQTHICCEGAGNKGIIAIRKDLHEINHTLEEPAELPASDLKGQT